MTRTTHYKFNESYLFLYVEFKRSFELYNML